VQQLTLFANFLPVSFLAARGHWSATRGIRVKNTQYCGFYSGWLPEIAAGQCCQLFPLFSGHIGKRMTAEKKFSSWENKAVLTEIVF
jgi:hypothetical protein